MATEFVVPESGTYHFVTGMTPHLVVECGPACRPVPAFGVEIEFDTTAMGVAVQNSGTVLKTEDLVVTEVTWEEYPRDGGELS